MKLQTKNNFFWASLIALLILIAYFPSLRNAFTNWDDNLYIYDNPAIRTLSLASIKVFFTEFFMGNYHPWTMLSIAVDYAVGGNNAFVHHAHSLFFHISTSLLVFVFLKKLTNNLLLSLVPALLFGIHPMHVESVAWASERKNVLYAFYFMISMLSYLYFLKEGKRIFYLLSILAFVFSLLSKGLAVSLAPSLLLIDYFLGRKLISKKVLLEKIPFFLLALLFGIIAVLAQDASKTFGLVEIKKFYHPLLFGAYNFCEYLWKLLFPYQLSPYYPYPPLVNDALPSYFYYYPVGAIILFAVMLYGIKKSKYFAFGFLFFLFNIALLLQFIPVGTTIMADRYAYLPSIGFFFALSHGIDLLLKKFQSIKVVVYTTIFAYMMGLSFLTHKQTKVWKDSISLWECVTKIYPYESIPNFNLATAYNKAGRQYDAVKHYKVVIENAPKKYASAAYACRSEANRDLGLLTEAYRDALYGFKLNPAASHNCHELGKVYEELGRADSALFYYEKTLSIDSLYEDALLDKGIVEAGLGKLKSSVYTFDLLLQHYPENIDGWFNRGVSYALLGDLEKAIEDYTKAILLKPDFSLFYNNRGDVFRQLKKYDQALADFSKTIALDNKHAFAYNNRARVKLETENLESALEDVNKSLKLDSSNAYAYKNKAKILLLQASKKEACENILKGISLAKDSIIQEELKQLKIENCKE